jgi:hypothetical protein
MTVCVRFRPIPDINGLLRQSPDIVSLLSSQKLGFASWGITYPPERTVVVTQRLNRKARTAIIVAVVLLFAGPLYLAAKLVIAKLVGTQQVVHPEDDQLVMLKDGSTMLVRHGSTARIIADWLQNDPNGAKTIRVGNENFAPGSATLTHDGWEHLAQFSQMLKAHNTVNAEILYSAHHGIASTIELEHMRADRIREEALNQGVYDDQIVVAPEGFEADHNAAKDEGLELVLTNRG